MLAGGMIWSSLALLTVIPEAVVAQTNYFFTNATTTAQSWSLPIWSNTLNSVATAPTSGGSSDYLITFNGNAAFNVTNDLGTVANSGFQLNQLIFSAGTPTLYGSDLVFLTSSTGVGPQVLQNTGNAIAINNGLVFSNNTTFGGTGSGALTLTGTLSGNSNLVVNGGGLLQLGIPNANTPNLPTMTGFTGNTVISNGSKVSFNYGGYVSQSYGLGSGTIILDNGMFGFANMSTNQCKNYGTPYVNTMTNAITVNAGGGTLALAGTTQVLGGVLNDTSVFGGTVTLNGTLNLENQKQANGTVPNQENWPQYMNFSGGITVNGTQTINNVDLGSTGGAGTTLKSTIYISGPLSGSGVLTLAAPSNTYWTMAAPTATTDLLSAMRAAGGSVKVASQQLVLNSVGYYRLSDFAGTGSNTLMIQFGSRYNGPTLDTANATDNAYHIGTSANAFKLLNFVNSDFSTITNSKSAGNNGTVKIDQGGTLWLNCNASVGAFEVDGGNFQFSTGATFRVDMANYNQPMRISADQPGSTMVNFSLGSGNNAVTETVTLATSSWGEITKSSKITWSQDNGVILCYSGMVNNCGFGWTDLGSGNASDLPVMGGLAGTVFAPLTNGSMYLAGPASGNVMVISNTATLTTSGTVQFENTISAGSFALGPLLVSNGVLNLAQRGVVSVSTLTLTNGGKLTGIGTVSGVLSNVTSGVVAPGAGQTLNVNGSLFNSGIITVNTGGLVVSGIITNLGTTIVINGLLGAGGLFNGAGNTISNVGGIYQFTTTTPTITPNGFGNIALANGTISFQAVTNADVTSSTAGSSALANLSFAGTTTFMLNAASNTAAATSQNYTFGVVAGNPSNYVNLTLVNGQTAYGNGSVTISNSGALLASNTLVTFSGPLTNMGSTVFVNSVGTFNANAFNSGTWTVDPSTNNFAGNLDNAGTMLLTNSVAIVGGDLINESRATYSMFQTSATYVAGVFTNQGALNILSGSMLTNGNAFISGSSTAILSDAGSVWSNLSLTIGSTGAGGASVLVTNGGLLSSTSASFVGNGSSNNVISIIGSTWNLGGSSLTLGSGAATGNVLNVLRGGILTNATTVTLGGSGSIFNLSGTASVNSVNLSTTDAQLNFNGGVLAAQASGNLITGLGTAWVQNAGATVDTVGNNATITTPLVDVAGGTGGLTKLGAGALTLTGTNILGQLVMTASSASLTNTLNLGTNSVTAVIGANTFNFTLTGTAGVTNLVMNVNGTLTTSNAANYVVALNGTVNMGPGSLLDMRLGGNQSGMIFSNLGVLVQNGSTSIWDFAVSSGNNDQSGFGRKFVNTGTWLLTNNAAFLYVGVQAPGSYGVLTGNRNSGTITVLNGSTLTFADLANTGTLVLGTNVTVGAVSAITINNTGVGSVTINGTNVLAGFKTADASGIFTFNNGNTSSQGATFTVGNGVASTDFTLGGQHAYLNNYTGNTVTVSSGATLTLFTAATGTADKYTQIENWGQFNLGGTMAFRPNQWDLTFLADKNDIHNFGTFTVSGNSASIVRQAANATAATNFIFGNDPGALFTGTGILTYTNTTAQAALKYLQLKNAGTVAPTTGGSLTLSNMVIINTGTILADGSTLTIAGLAVTNVGGTIVVANGGGWFAPGLLSAGGSVIITGGPSASTFSNTGAVVIGDGISDPGNGTLTISNANAWSAGLTIGSGSSNNTVSVYTNTMWNMLAGSIGVGSSAATGDVVAINGGIVTNAGTVVIGNGLTSFGNTLSVSNGGKLYSGNVTLGNGAGASNNSYNVGGLGATLSTVSNGTITVGNTAAGFNTMTVTNANLWSSGLFIGAGSSNNTVSVYSNVTWNLLGKSLSVGTNAATGNSLTINGGMITNLSGATGFGNSGLEIGYTVGANGNSLTLTNGGQIFLSGTVSEVRLGIYSASNQLTVVGGPGGVTSTLNGGNAELTIGQGSGSPGFGSASNNVFTVSTGGIVTNIGGFATGAGGWGTTLGVAVNGATSSVNQLVIQAGGQFWANSNMNVGYISSSGAGNTSVAASNSVVVNGGSLNIARGLTIGNGNGVANLGVNFNSVTVSNGGNLTVLGLIAVGNGPGASFNSLTINGGMITNLSGTGGVGDSDLEIGYTQGANGNSLTLTNGGQIFLNGTVKEVRLGLYSASNQMTVVGGPGGVTSTLNGGNTELTIGQGNGSAGNGSASNNVFTVSTGGIVTNIGGFASASSGGWGTTLGVAVNGATSSVNQLVIQASGQFWANSNMNVGYIYSSGAGNTSVASSNSVVVNGGSLNIGLGLTIGNGTNANLGVNFNSVTVSNGGSLTVLGAVKVGSGAGASNNSYNVGGFGTPSAVTNGAITVGDSGGGFNTMTVTNANLWSTGLIVGGNNSSNNTVTIQDAASTWNFGGGAITVGSLNGTGANGATGNQFIAASAGTYGLSNIGGINLYSANNSLFLSNQNLAASISALNLGAPGLGGNSLTLSNQAFTASAASTIGKNSSNNTLRVVGPTTSWNLGGNVFYVGTGTATGNVVTIDGAAVSGVSTVLVGDVGSGNSLIITNGGQLTTTGRSQIGGNVFASVAGGSSNLVLVVGGGTATSVWNVSGSSIEIGGNGASGGAATGNVLRVDGAGASGSAVLSNAAVIRIGYSRYSGTSIGNSLIVTNGGALYAGEIDVGLNVNGGTSSSNNFYIIDGGSVGSIVSNGSIIVGDNNSGTASGPVGYNTMSVTNAQLLSSNVTLGLISSYNTILVKTNTTWNLLGNGIVIGSGAATGNVMTVNGGTITNAGSVTIGASTGSIGNSLVISNGGNFFSGNVTFGYQYSAATIASNLYQVGGLGAASYAYNGSIVVGYQNNNYFNTLTVTNATLSSGGVGIGYADQWDAANNNTANVLSGGVWDVRGGGVTIGKGQSTGNMLTVNGGILTNINTLYISMGMGQGPVSASYNSLVITNGGQVFVVAGNSLIGGANWNNTNNNNQLIVNNGTFNSVGFLQVGAGDQATGGRGDTNSLTVANGGYVSVSNLTVGCFPLASGWGSASNTVTVAGANAAGSNATINLRGGYLFIGNGDQATNNLVLVGGGGVITNAGAVTIGGLLTSANNSLIITNGGALFSGAVSIGSANLCNNNLYKIDGGSVGSVVSNGAITLGSAGGSYNTMTVTNANLLNSGGLTIGGTGATNNTASVLANATWNLLGGNITIGTGTNNSLTVATGGVLTNAGAVTLSGVGSVFTLGGTAAVNSINLSTTDARLNFNGGVLLAQATGNLITGLGTAFVQNAGATVDTLGNNATITTPLVDDTGSSGGFTKLGAGALTLTGTNTIGQLAMTASSASTTNKLILSGNSVLTLAGNNGSAYSPFNFNLSGAAGVANLELDVYGTPIVVTNASYYSIAMAVLNGTVKLGTNGGSAASLTIAGSVSSVLTNLGVLNIAGGSTLNLQLYSGGASSKFFNTGTNIMDNGILLFTGINSGGNTPSPITFNNSGLWTLQNGSSLYDNGYLSNIGINGVNSGTLNVLSGSTLTFNTTLNSSGTLTLGTNAVLGYSGSVVALYNSGLMTVNGTNVTLQGVNNGVDYLINSGTLNIGNGSASASFTMNTLSGAITNTGTMNILSNSTLTLAASGQQGSWFIYNSGVITQNTGAVVINWDAVGNNTSYPRTWQNTGTWVLQNGSSITITSSTGNAVGWMLGSPIINSGTLMVLSGSTVVIGPNGAFNGALNNTGLLVLGTNSLVGTTIQTTSPILNNTAGGTVSVIATNAMLGYTNAVTGTVTFTNGSVSGLQGATLTIGTNGASASFVMSGGAGVLYNFANNTVTGNGLLLFTNTSGTAANNNMNFVNAGTLTPLAGSTLTLSNVVINNTGAISVTNATLILGNGTLTDTAGGVAIQTGGLLEANNLIFTGGVLTNAGGVLQFATVSPTLTGAGGVINNGTIAYRNVATANINNSQVSNLVFLGQNTFRLNASSNTTAGQTYTFATNLGATNYARLELINGATAYRGGDLTIGSTGTMLVSNTAASIGGNLTNAGVLTILNSPITFASNFINQGTVQLGSNSTVTGLLTMSNGTLAILGNWAQTWTSNINLQATGTFDTSGGNLTLAGAVTNSNGLLVKTGSGVLTLAATNTYTGGTVVQNGSLIMGNALAVSNGTALTVNNGIFDPNGNARIVSTLNGTGGVISNYGLTVTGGGNFSGVIAGPGGLVSTGTVSSVLILGGNNTYSGSTTISNGTLLAANSSALSTGAVATLAGATLQLSNNITLGNVLTLFGTGVSNTGVLASVSGTNYLTGPVTVGSAVRLTADAGQLTLSNLVNSGGFNLSFGGAGTTIVAQVIGSGSGSLWKDGAGALILNGALGYTGPTTVSNGTLAVNGSLSGASVVNVFSNATLTGSALLGNVTISGGGTIAPGNNGVGTITAAALTLAANSKLAFEFGPGAFDQIIVTNLSGLLINGGVLDLYKANTTTTFDLMGSYPLIEYAGTLDGTVTNLLAVDAATKTGNRLYGFSLNGGWLTLSITSTGGLGWVGSALNNNWSTSANWAGSQIPAAGDQLIFDGQTGLNNTNDLAAHTQFSGIFFNGTAGAFTLNSNAVDLLSGVVNLSANTQTLNLPLVLAANGLVFDANAGSLVVNGAISETNGSFGLAKSGAYTLTLAGANTYTGGTILNAGTLSVGAISDTGASGISTSGVLTFNGGALQFTGAGAGSTTRGITNIGLAVIDVTNSSARLTLGGVISGANGLLKYGAGTLVLTGANTYVGGTTISTGTVAISADNNLGAAGGALTLGGGTLEATNNFALDRTRDVTLNSPGGTFNVDNNSTFTMGNTIGGAGALTKTGAGTLVLSNAVNNYGGGTVISGGTLALGTDSGASEKDGALSSGGVMITGGSQLRLGGGAATTNSIGNSLTLNSGMIYAVDGVQHLTSTLTVNSGGGTLAAQAGTKDLFLDGVVSGSGALTIYDTGTTTGAGRGLVRFANNNNTYSGTVTITNAGNNGVLSVDTPTALQFATVNDLSGYGNSLVFYQAAAGATTATLGALGGTANIILQTWNTTAGGDPVVTGGAVTLTVGGNSNNTTYAGALGGSGALVKTGAGIMTLAGANANSGGVTVSNGTVLLSGGDNRLFTNGAVTVAGGTLNLGGFTQTNINTFTIAGGVLTNGTVAKSGADYLGQSGTVSATLGGSAGLTKTTTNTLTLNGTQTYTGATTLSNGTLVVNGALFGAGLVNVLSNATLIGNNATLGNVTVGTGGTLVPVNNGIGTLSMGTLTTAAGSLLPFDFTGATNDQFLVTADNGLTVAGGVFALYQSGTTRTFDALGTYNLIGYAGGIGGAGVSAFTVTNTVGNRLYTFDTAGNWVTLTIAGQGISWVGASPISAYWSDTNNWANHIVPTNGIAIFDGNTQTATINDLADHALLGGITFSTDAGAFSLSGLAPGTNVVDLEGAVINLSHNNQTINLPLVLVGAVGGGRTFNASNGAITVNGIISETNYAFSLVKTGTNLLVLTGANTYSGGTVLNAGTLGIGISSMGSTGALGSGTVFIHAGSLVAIGGAQTFNNAVGIVGNFSVGGNQDLTLAGPINLSNATRVITINNTANTFIAGTVSNGALTKAGNGLLTVTGALAYNGVTTINGGTLQLGNGGNTGTINNNATVQDNSALAFDRSDDLSFGNLITGTGDVVQNGTNVVTLSNDGNSYYGRTVINGGVVSVNFLTNGGVASDIGASSSAASNLVLNGGTLQYTGSGATLDRLFTLGDSGGTLSAYGGALNLTNPGALGMTGTVNRTLVLTGNSNGLLAASIGDPTSGQTALLKTGTNLWVLSNTNTYSGLTTINGGTLLLAGALAAQNSTVSNLIEGGLTFTNSASFIVGGLAGSGNLGLTNTSGGSITLSVGNNNSNTTYLGVLSGSGALTKLGNGTLTLTTNQAYLGGTTVSAGTLQLGGLADTLSTNGAIRIAGGTLDLGGLGQFTTNAVTISSGLLTNGTLTKSGADYAGQGGTVAAVLAGEIGLTKTTGGTLILNGANTYTGATLISNGILQVNGQLIATGRVTVASGATLAGNGGTVGNVTVSSGGIVAPGSGGIGSLTLTTLTVTNGSLFNYEFATAANDQLFVTATNGLTINGGAFRLYQEGTTTTFDAPGTYNLISYAGLIQGSGTNNLSIDPTTQTGNRLYTFGTNGGWVTLTIAGQGTAWVGANSALWSDAGNWGDGTTVPTNGFAVFTGNSRLDTTNDLASAQFAGITFDNGAGTFTLNSENPGANIVTLAGAVVNLSSNIQTINLPLLIAGAQGGTFNASNANIIMAGNLTFDSYASGLLKTGPNVLELTGHNSYTQTTTIAGGILRVNAGAFSLNSNLIFTNGVLESRGVMSVTRSVGTGAGSIQWSGSGGFSANGGTLTVDLGGAGGTLVWGASSFVPNGSTLQFSSSQADSTVKFMNALNLNGGVRTIQVDNGTAFVDVDMTGAISGATGSGLIKTGAGLLRLSGNSSFSGALMVDAGTFLLASTLSNTSVFVHSGATVGGTGIFDSALTLASGGILAPGQSGAGLLTVSSLSLSNGFVYDWELGMTATDRVDVTTLSGLNYFGSNHWTLQLGAEPGVSAMAQWQGSGVLTDQFVLFQFNGSAPASLTNAFILGGGGWDASQARVSIVGNQVLLSGLMFNQSFVVIPEPNVLLMWLAGGFTLWAARRRRRNLKLVNEHSTRPRP